MGGIVVRLRKGIGWKYESKGRSPGSSQTAFLNSRSKRDPFPIIPADFKIVHKTGAVSFQTWSCMAFLETITRAVGRIEKLKV